MKFSGRYLWMIQAISGLLLIFLAGLHWVVQHYIASGGLRDYAAVVGYLQNPLAFSLEVFFLVVVAGHALLGVRAILMDFGPCRLAVRVINLALFFAGLLTIGYGVFLALDIIT